MGARVIDFAVADDREATVVYKALIGMGFAPRRILTSETEETLWLIAAAIERWRLTVHEARALGRILAGDRTVPELAAGLDCDKRRADWLAHCLRRKSGAADAEELVALVREAAVVRAGN